MRSYAHARNEMRIFQAEIYVETRQTVQYMGVNDGTPHQKCTLYIAYILLKQDTDYLVSVNV